MTGSGLTVWPVRGPHPSAHRMIRARSTGRVAPMMIRVVGRAWRKCWWWVLGIAAGLAGVVANRRMDHNARPRPSSSVDEGDWSGPDEYERLTSISKESYEWRLLVAAQSHLMGEWTVTPDNAPPYTREGMLEHGSVDDVRLEGDGLEAALVVLFRSDDRPGCVFGWRCPIWPAPSPDPDDDDGMPEGWALDLAAGLRELRDVPSGLPTCDSDTQGIIWVQN